MVTVWLTVPSLVPLASVIVPLSRPVASRTPLATENFCGVKVPAKVPWPSALVNVPVTVEVIVPGAAAGAAGAAAAGVAAAARKAACAVAALATLAVRPVAMAAAAAVIARTRRLGAFMISLSLGVDGSSRGNHANHQ